MLAEHFGGCESAEGVMCACPCAGTQHGIAAFKSARADRTLLVTNRQVIVNAYQDELKSYANPGRQPSRDILSRTIVAELVLYLNAAPEMLIQTELVASILARDLIDQFAESLRAEFSVDRRTNLTSLPAVHLWCGVLAAMAEAGQRLTTLSDQVRDEVAEHARASAYVQTRARPTRWIDGEIRALFVKQIWNRTQAAIEACTSIKTFLTSVQIMAVIMCPNLRRHAEIRRWCLVPLFELFTSDLVGWIVAAYPDLSDMAPDRAAAHRLGAH